MRELLSRLHKCDPTTYENFAMLHQMNPVIGIESKVSLAWLQACLQRAIAARNSDRSGNMSMWAFYLRYGNKGYHAEVFIGGRKFPADADSPTQALLAAYVAACEAP